MLQHVSLEVKPEDTARCVAFWRLLGFELVDAPGSLSGRATWVQRGPTQIHLLYTDEPHVPPEGHAAVVVDDYDRTLEALRENGFDPDPRQEHWGAPRSFVRDPAGHRVEL